MGGLIRPGSRAAVARRRAPGARPAVARACPLGARSAAARARPLGARSAAARGRLLGAWAAAVRGRLLGARPAAARARPFGARPAAARARRLGTWAVVALLVAAVGCGGERGASDTDQVRATLVQFGRATSRHDFTTVCERLLAPALVAKLSQIGLPCVQALEQGLGDVRAPKLSVGRITVRGDRARAVVRTSAEGQQPSEDTVELARVNGSWRIASLAGTGT